MEENFWNIYIYANLHVSSYPLYTEVTYMPNSVQQYQEPLILWRNIIALMCT